MGQNCQIILDQNCQIIMGPNYQTKIGKNVKIVLNFLDKKWTFDILCPFSSIDLLLMSWEFFVGKCLLLWSIFRVKIFQKAMSLRFSLFSFTSNHFVWRKPKNGGVRKWKVKNCTSITTSIFVTDLGRGFATRSHNTSLTSKFSGIFEGQTWAPRSHGIKCHTFATLSQTGVTFCNFAETYVTTDNQCQLRFLQYLKVRVHSV